MRVFITVLVLIFSLHSFSSAEENVTWGLTGEKCSTFIKNKEEFSSIKEEFQKVVESEVRGFLTGYNLYEAVENKNLDKLKTINYDSTEFIYNKLMENCRKNSNEYVFMILIDYYYELPFAK